MTERAIEAAALEYATNLAKALARKHFPDVPQWKPADDLMTVLTQIDNMTTGMIRPAALAEDDAAVERIAWEMVRSTEDPDNPIIVLGRMSKIQARAALRALGE